jgi:transposase
VFIFVPYSHYDEPKTLSYFMQPVCLLNADGGHRIVLEGLRGEDSISELCRKEGIAQSLYYTWSKEFMEAGKRRLAGDTARAATSGEVQDLRREARALKECVADLTLENRLLKKSMIADGDDDA